MSGGEREGERFVVYGRCWVGKREEERNKGRWRGPVGYKRKSEKRERWKFMIPRRRIKDNVYTCQKLNFWFQEFGAKREKRIES